MMHRPTIAHSIYKLAVAGEQAGFTVEQMIQLLNDGLDVMTLVSLIEWKLNHASSAVSLIAGLRRAESEAATCHL